MRVSIQLIHRAFAEYRPMVAFSGGADSSVLLDMVAKLGYKCPVVYVDTQQEHNSNLPWARKIANEYGFEFHVAKGVRTPEEQFKKTGYPFLGSGTSLIAAENERRTLYAVELNPVYIAVALERWSNHTGGEPKLAGRRNDDP